jgi:hypothetical protein
MLTILPAAPSQACPIIHLCVSPGSGTSVEIVFFGTSSALCKAVRPDILVLPKIRLTESGTVFYCLKQLTKHHSFQNKISLPKNDHQSRACSLVPRPASCVSLHHTPCKAYCFTHLELPSSLTFSPVPRNPIPHNLRWKSTICNNYQATATH